MDRPDTPEEKMPCIPTFVLDHNDEPGPPTELSATKESVDEISQNQHPESPCHKVWAQHNPPNEGEAAQCEEKDVYLDVSEVEAIMSKPDHKITVRILRRILSIMMVILYKTETEIANKRKMKSLWDRRPSDWPHNVPFKDPNNGVKMETGRHGHKPIHKELLQMYQFLKKKYQREVRILTTGETNSLQGYPDIKNEPFSPMTPKLEPAQSMNIPNEHGDEMAALVMQPNTHSTGPPPPLSPIPQVIAPDGIDVRVEYIPAAAPPSPEVGRLHQVLESQYQRLIEHFTEVQHLVNAYNPLATEDFETMGKELECLLEETRNQPDRFSLIFNDVGHKVESFLSKVQMLGMTYVVNPHFEKECQSLAADIKKRTAAALSVPYHHPSMQVGMVLDNNPPPLQVYEGCQPDRDVANRSSNLMSVVRQRTTYNTSAAACGGDDPKKSPNGVQTITNEDLAVSISAVGPLQTSAALEMNPLFESLVVVRELEMRSTDSDETDVKVRAVEMSGDGGYEAAAAAPTTDEVIENVLDLECLYGDWMLSPQSAVSDLQSPITPEPRYISEDPAILSIHDRSPYPHDMSDAMVVTVNPELDSVAILEDEVKEEDFVFCRERGDAAASMQRQAHVDQPSPGGQPTVNTLPLTVVSMDMETDHEDDHFQLSHQGISEEVYCD